MTDRGLSLHGTPPPPPPPDGSVAATSDAAFLVDDAVVHGLVLRHVNREDVLDFAEHTYNRTVRWSSTGCYIPELGEKIVSCDACARMLYDLTTTCSPPRWSPPACWEPYFRIVLYCALFEHAARRGASVVLALQKAVDESVARIIRLFAAYGVVEGLALDFRDEASHAPVHCDPRLPFSGSDMHAFSRVVALALGVQLVCEPGFEEEAASCATRALPDGRWPTLTETEKKRIGEEGDVAMAEHIARLSLVEFQSSR